LHIDLGSGSWFDLRSDISNIANCLSGQNRLAKELAWRTLELELFEAADLPVAHYFRASLNLFVLHSRSGRWFEAERAWGMLAMIDRPKDRRVLSRGAVEYHWARFLLYRGRLTESELETAEREAAHEKNRFLVRRIRTLRGEWQLERGEWESAALSFDA